MTPFVILAIVLSVAVLLAVLWPLWRDARGLVLAGVATLGVATFALYRVVGTPAARHRDEEGHDQEEQEW